MMVFEEKYLTEANLLEPVGCEPKEAKTIKQTMCKIYKRYQETGKFLLPFNPSSMNKVSFIY